MNGKISTWSEFVLTDFASDAFDLLVQLEIWVIFVTLVFRLFSMVVFEMFCCIEPMFGLLFVCRELLPTSDVTRDSRSPFCLVVSDWLLFSLLTDFSLFFICIRKSLVFSSLAALLT